MRPFLARAALALGGLLAALALLEGALRIAASLEGRRLAEEVPGNDPLRRPTVVFCGDSHVYGIYVSNEETLPSAVERVSRASGGAGLRCVNLGIPGSASWNVLEQVRAAAAIRPAAIVVRCGFNDYSVRRPREGLGVLENLRIVKMLRRAAFNARMAREDLRSHSLELGPGGAAIEGYHIPLEDGRSVVVVKDRLGETQVYERAASGEDSRGFEDLAPGLRAELLSMAGLAREWGSRLVLATYLAGDEGLFAPISRLQREVAASGAAALADCAAVFGPALRRGSDAPLQETPPYALLNRRSMLLFGDFHPTPLGYEVEARVVAAALRGIGVAAAGDPGDPLAPLDEARVVLPALAPRAGEPLAFDVATEPGDRLVLFLGGEGSARTHDAVVPVRLADANAIRRRLGLPEREYTADGTGRAVLHANRALFEALPRPVFAAVLATRDASAGSLRRFASPPVRVEG